jgi:hypothetical protein
LSRRLGEKTDEGDSDTPNFISVKSTKDTWSLRGLHHEKILPFFGPTKKILFFSATQVKRSLQIHAPKYNKSENEKCRAAEPWQLSDRTSVVLSQAAVHNVHVRLINDAAAENKT